jgi:hypothetical protein
MLDEFKNKFINKIVYAKLNNRRDRLPFIIDDLYSTTLCTPTIPYVFLWLYSSSIAWAFDVTLSVGHGEKDISE